MSRLLSHVYKENLCSILYVQQMGMHINNCLREAWNNSVLGSYQLCTG